jgi:hypothetical protein
LLDHLNSDGFDYGHDRLFHFPRDFLHWRGLGLGLATVRFSAFAALAALRALPRLAELRSFARFCTFDAFLRLAMIRPALVGGPQRMMSDQKGAAMDQASYHQISA